MINELGAVFSRLLANDPLPDWVTSLVPVLKIVLIVAMALGAVGIIILVLLQQSNSSGGVSAISGATETYYAQNKGKTREGRLKLVTTITAITIAVMAVLYFVLLRVIS